MKLLVVEDEARLARLLARGLQEEGHQVDVCGNARDADEQARLIDYDVILLDWMLPDRDGLSLLRDWRGGGVQTPVLMLTARATSGEKVAGLRGGADDYVVKPFDFDELLARLEALHRRAGGHALAREAGDVILDVRRRSLVRGEDAVELTPREYGLCEELFGHVGEVLTRAELLSTVWGPNFDGEPNVVDVYVGYVRRKLEALGTERARIRTVRGIGFRLEATEPQA